jgi:release factor glutamine methyltransferase
VSDVAEAVRRLTAAGVGNPRLDARVLWEHAKTLSSPITGEADVDAVYASLIARRVAREPVAYITGMKEFWSLELEVGPGVLIPRPETETIVEAVLKAFPDRTARLSILDLGTGSGCILAALLSEYRAAQGIGVEASSAASTCAKRNLFRHGLDGRGQVCDGNWQEAVSGAFDVVVSNPPYIESGDISGLEPEVAEYEPPQALDGGPDGLTAYRILAPKIMRWLRSGGAVFLEVGAGQDRAVKQFLEDAGLIFQQAVQDLAGIPRVVAARRP